MEGVSLQKHYDAIRIMVKLKTGRAMQEKYAVLSSAFRP